MSRGLRRVAKEQPSTKYPGYLERDDGKYSKLYLYRGRYVRQYYIERNCSCCHSSVLVDRHNAMRQKYFFCSKKCRSDARSAPDGRKKYKRGSIVGGHILVKAASHPAARKGFVSEHRLVIERHVGRYLREEERVHHINMVEDDNRLENLFLCSSNSEHHKIHGSLNECVITLMNRGHLMFDHVAKRYFVP
jgi:hypothetical protein